MPNARQAKRTLRPRADTTFWAISLRRDGLTTFLRAPLGQFLLSVAHRHTSSSVAGFRLPVPSFASSARHPSHQILHVTYRSWRCSCRVPDTERGLACLTRLVSESTESGCRCISMFSFENLLRSVYEKILLLMSASFGADYPIKSAYQELDGSLPQPGYPAP